MRVPGAPDKNGVRDGGPGDAMAVAIHGSAGDCGQDAKTRFFRPLNFQLKEARKPGKRR